MKPYIISHMMESVDGRIDCAMTEKFLQVIIIMMHWSNWNVLPN